MDNIDYKIALNEIISLIKDKATYLKSINSNDKNLYQAEYYQGMLMAYHFVMDGIKEYIKNDIQMDLSDFGLEDYNPNEILNYKPIKDNGSEFT